MEGFEVPVHKSLCTRILMNGVPREMAILNGTLTAAVVFGLHNIYFLPFGVLMHVLAVHMTKKDDMWFEIFRRQLHQKKYYYD